jgi:hypothetical protein
MTSSEMTPADFAAVTGNRNDGFGGNGFEWIVILFLFAMFGGWGGNRGGFGGNGFDGSYGLYPWLNQSNQVNDGFRDQMLNSSIMGIQNNITSGFGDVQTALCGGFAGVNASIAAAQNGITQQMYANQIADMQQNFGLQSQLANCCCENRLATCQTQNIVQNEGAQTRMAIQGQTQAILDKLCQLELDGVKAELAQAQRENVGLQNQLNMATLRESQTAQNAFIQQGLNNEVDALYNRLNSCPVPTTPVYGRTPIFTCGGNQGCSCGLA